MPRKKEIHGENCPICMKIATLIYNSKNGKVRFNELVKKGKKTIEPNFSAPVLRRHLKGMEGKFIKRHQITPYNVEYSLAFPREKIDEARKLYDSQFKTLTIEQLVLKYFQIAEFAAYEEMATLIKQFLKTESPEQLNFHIQLVSAGYKQSYIFIKDAMLNRQPTEYLEALKKLEDMREKVFPSTGKE
jgi:hypothetical protein